jgi:hypothetical protein
MARKLYGRLPHPLGEVQLELSWSSEFQKSSVDYRHLSYPDLRKAWEARPGILAHTEAYQRDNTHRRWRSLGKKARHGAKVKI